MSSSSPADVAVTFRSIPRRLREAGEPSNLPAPLTAAISRGAALVHSSSTDPESIASAIESVPADQWDKPTLDALRAVALDIGKALRDLEQE